MRTSTALLVVCSAAAALLRPLYAKPLAARQTLVGLPLNTTVHSGPLINLEGTAADDLILCPPGLADIATTRVVAINPTVWGSGSFCGDNANVWYNDVGYDATVIAECTQCPDNGIGLYPAFYELVTSRAFDEVVEGEWAVDGE